MIAGRIKYLFDVSNKVFAWEDVYYTSMCTVIYTSNYGNYYAMISIPDKQMYKSSWWYIIL
jgi:hypothetical protein